MLCRQGLRSSRCCGPRTPCCQRTGEWSSGSGSTSGRDRRGREDFRRRSQHRCPPGGTCGGWRDLYLWQCLRADRKTNCPALRLSREHEVKNITRPVRVYRALMDNGVVKAEAVKFKQKGPQRKILVFCLAGALILISGWLYGNLSNDPPRHPLLLLPRPSRRPTRRRWPIPCRTNRLSPSCRS